MNKEHEIIVALFVADVRTAQQVVPERRQLLLTEASCIAQGEEWNLLMALVTAVDGCAEWLELHGTYASVLLQHLVQKITILVKNESTDYPKTYDFLQTTDLLSAA